MDAEGLGDGGAGDISVQNTDLIATRRMVTASWLVTMDLPTPPLPDTIP